MSSLTTDFFVSLTTPGFIQGLGMWEILAILAVGVLIFGGRLPEVGKNIGKAIVEFKKGVKGVTDDIDSSVKQSDESAAERKKLDQSGPTSETQASQTAATAEQAPQQAKS